MVPHSQFDSDSDTDNASYVHSQPRPASPACLDSDEDDEDWDLRDIKYTGGMDLKPIFNKRLDVENADEEEFWAPGTPTVERKPYDWDSRPSSSAARRMYDDEDESDGSDIDDDEVWPDEMDSVSAYSIRSAVSPAQLPFSLPLQDDFPHLHTWPHSWIWHPSNTPSTTAMEPLPSIHFHYIESQPPDQSAWTPLQDSLFGNMLTVPGHRAYNTQSPPQFNERSPPISFEVPYAYVPTLGRCVVEVMSVEEQERLGICSVLDVDWSSGMGRKRRKATSDAEERGRSRRVVDLDRNSDAY